MVEIYDDFLHEVEFEKIKNLLLGNRFPWVWSNVLDYGEGCDPDCEEIYNWQASNLLYAHMRPLKEEFAYMTPIINDDRLGIGSVCRIKVNLNPITSEHIEHGMHIDTPFECTTGIFYVNTNNGYTIFEDGTKIDCVANRMITFPSSMPHSGGTTTDTAMKVVINFNYFQVKHTLKYSNGN